MNKGLTTFRAFAFFAVFLFHVDKLGAGYLGVQAFFVLSGFLLTPILLEMKASLSTKDFFLHFYGRRALRIFPLYYFYLGLVALLSAFVFSRLGFYSTADADKFMAQLPWSATFTYDFFHASRYFERTLLVTHFWSLAIEEQFYLVWPLAIFCLPQKYFKTFLILVCAGGLLLRALLALISLNQMVPILHNETDLAIYVLPFSHIDAFAIGGFFALYAKSRSGLTAWLAIFMVAAIGMSASWLTSSSIGWSDLGYPSFMKDSYKFVWGYSLVNLLFAYILVCVRDGKFLPAIFENTALNYLGKISYGMYVFHFPVLWLIDVAPIFGGMPEYTLILLALAITIALSIISYELMEKRFLSLKDKYFSRARQPVHAHNNS